VRRQRVAASLRLRMFPRSLTILEFPGTITKKLNGRRKIQNLKVSTIYTLHKNYLFYPYNKIHKKQRQDRFVPSSRFIKINYFSKKSPKHPKKKRQSSLNGVERIVIQLTRRGAVVALFSMIAENKPVDALQRFPKRGIVLSNVKMKRLPRSNSFNDKLP